MKVFLSGGRGMLGSHIKRELESEGHFVIAPTSSELDLRNSEATRYYLNKVAPEAVIHAAAVVGGIQANIEGGSRFLTENLEIDHSVIFNAKELEVENFIYIGSSCMYPANRQEPLQLQDLLSGPLEPTNASYALAKISGAKAVEAFDSSSGLNWKTFIASNLYGPGDHFEPRRSHLLAAIIAKVEEAKRMNYSEIVMWGDGQIKREFTYVEDFARWIAVSVTSLQKFPSMLNVGYGVDYSVRQFYEISMEILGYQGKLTADTSKPNGNLRKLMDSAMARDLGWAPSTNIQDGILKTYKWYLEQNGPH